MRSVFIFNLFLFIDLYVQFREYQVEAKARVNSRSLANDVDSPEKVNLAFVNEVLFDKNLESGSSDSSPSNPPPKHRKRKFRIKKRRETEEESEPKRKPVKKHKKKGKKKKVSKFSKALAQDNSSQSMSSERKKPFDIVVHIKVNE